ncbi:MAG: hypothetical protein JO222_11670, partial [Frankiales bacterium]|nr:hypothetical protein [Frankiales bacterium]
MSLEPQGGYGNGALLPGPAGYITVPGTSGVVVVDAVNPHRILESLPAETQHDATLTAVAVAEAHVQRTHIIAPLAALETVLAANASEEYDALVDDRIWRTLPAAVAVARAAADAPGIVDNLSLRHREQLRDRVRALQAGLRRRHWTGAGTSDLEGLALLLTEPPDVPATEVSADVGLRVAGVDSGAAGFALDLSTDDLRLDLGELADLMFAGATFAGVIPGLVEVRAVLQVNASGQLPTLVAQIAMPNGEIVAEAPVRVLTDRRVLPLATAELQVPAIAGERSTDLHGTVVAARPSPRTADSWRRLAL